MNACQDAIQWLNKQSTNDFYELFELAKNENHLDWANWYIAQIMTKEQRMKYAIFAAELVLHIFTEKYPDDKRPENGIKAIRAYLENPTAGNKRAAAYAAVVNAAAYGAAYAAACAAYDACAAYAADAKKETLIKIIEHGISLVMENE